MTIQIIQERKNPSSKEKFAQTMNNFMERGSNMASEYGQQQRQNQMQETEDKKLSQILGQDVSGLSPEMKKAVFQQIMTGKNLEQEYGFKGKNLEQEYLFKDMNQSRLEELRHQGLSSRQKELERLRQKHKKDLIGEQNQMQGNENLALQKMTGQDFAGLSPEMKKLAFQQIIQGQNLEQEYGLKSKQKGDELAGKRQENLATFQSGLETVEEMRKIRKRGNLGRGSGIMGTFGGQIAKDRGEYQTLGKSLISLQSNIPIRNQAEFKVLAEKLYDPSITDDEAEGILNAMENIIKRSAKQYQGEEGMGMQEQGFSSQNLPSAGQSQQQRPPLTAFMR